MTMFKAFRFAMLAVLAAALASGGVSAQVTTRFVGPCCQVTTTKIVPGSTASFDVVVDAPTVSTIGAAYRLTQTSPVSPSGFFTITGRVDVGDPPAAPNPLYPYNDQLSGSPNSAVLASPGSSLDPDSDADLGRNSVGNVGIGAQSGILVTGVTLTASPLTPLGIYRIQPTPGVSFVHDTAANDYAMDAAYIDILVGQRLTVIKIGTGTGTVKSSPAGIDCGPICSDIFLPIVFMLTATPDPHSMFAGWSGPCAGLGECLVTGGTVTARFDVPVFAPRLVNSKSRRAHGGAGTFDLLLNASALDPTTEPRGGPAQTIVMTFDKPIASAGNPTVSEGAAAFGSMSIAGNDVILNFTGVTNPQYVTVNLANVASTDSGIGGFGSVRVGFLFGDVNQSRQVTVADLGIVNGSLLQPVTAANFFRDVNADGRLTVADKGLVNANLLKKLPTP